jgi:hypothetical protein
MKIYQLTPETNEPSKRFNLGMKNGDVEVAPVHSCIHP